MAGTRTAVQDGSALRVWGWDGSSLGGASLVNTDRLKFAAGDANLCRYVGNDRSMKSIQVGGKAV